jgi:hypothetical protein
MPVVGGDTAVAPERDAPVKATLRATIPIVGAKETINPQSSPQSGTLVHRIRPFHFGKQLPVADNGEKKDCTNNQLTVRRMWVSSTRI